MAGINVAFGVDGGALDLVSVVIRSVLASAAAPEQLRFFVAYAGETREAEARMARWRVPLAQVELVPVVSNPFERQHIHSHFTHATYLRLLLPDLLPKLGRVLYLDADMVVQHDIAALHDTPLDGAVAAGVIDMGLYILARRSRIRGASKEQEHLQSLGLAPTGFEYVNAGALVMDLEAMRAEDFTRRAIETGLARRYEFLDQDILNRVLRGRIRHVDPRWNVLAGLMRATRLQRFVPEALRHDLARQLANPWITHFAGHGKPWKIAEAWNAEGWWCHADEAGPHWERPSPKPKKPGAALERTWLDLRAGFSLLRARLTGL